MVFMFIVPGIPASLGNFFLPLMLGAKDVAFPRLNLGSWYVYVVRLDLRPWHRRWAASIPAGRSIPHTRP